MTLTGHGAERRDEVNLRRRFRLSMSQIGAQQLFGTRKRPTKLKRRHQAGVSSAGR